MVSIKCTTPCTAGTCSLVLISSPCSQRQGRLHCFGNCGGGTTAVKCGGRRRLFKKSLGLGSIGSISLSSLQVGAFDSFVARCNRHPVPGRSFGAQASAGVRGVIAESTSKNDPIRKNVLGLMGNTPMVYLTRVASRCCAKIACKIEARRPCRSVKDRIALAMVEDAERRGIITPGVSTLVEPTGGNTGIDLAFVCASKGYKVILTMPEDQSIERRILVQAFGAQEI